MVQRLPRSEGRLVTALRRPQRLSLAASFQTFALGSFDLNHNAVLHDDRHLAELKGSQRIADLGQ